MFDEIDVRTVQVLKREGLRGVAARVMEKIVSVRTSILLQQNLRAGVQDETVPGLSFAWAALEDLERWESLDLVSTSERRQAAQTRLARGDRCLVGLFDGAPATYLWTTTTARELPRLVLPVGSGSIFVYKTFTLPVWRGRGFNRAAVLSALRQYRREGCCTAFVDVDDANAASLRSLASAGFSEVARFRIWAIGCLVFTSMPDNAYSRVAGHPTIRQLRSVAGS